MFNWLCIKLSRQKISCQETFRFFVLCNDTGGLYIRRRVSFPTHYADQWSLYLYLLVIHNDRIILSSKACFPLHLFFSPSLCFYLDLFLKTCLACLLVSQISLKDHLSVFLPCGQAHFLQQNETSLSLLVRFRGVVPSQGALLNRQKSKKARVVKMSKAPPLKTLCSIFVVAVFHLRKKLQSPKMKKPLALLMRWRFELLSHYCHLANIFLPSWRPSFHSSSTVTTHNPNWLII